MKRKLLMTAAAIALMAGMNGASAQTGGGEQQQPRMQNSPPGATAPRSEETVKPGIHEREPGAAVQNDQKEKTKIGQGQNEAQPRREGQATPMDQNGTREQMGQQGQGQIQGQGQMEQKERATQQGAQKQNTAGQGSQSSAKSVQLSSEQRTKIHATFAQGRPERITNANFTIRVGARVPRTVRFYPLPVEIVDIVPEYQGYDYVLVGDEILIIDPETLEIVAVLPA
jgi:Protein of unknown function (DUF1236)